MVIISPHLSYILCSTTYEEDKNSQLRLININDVVDNEICIRTSQIDLSQSSLMYNEETSTLTKIPKKTRSYFIYF